MNHPPRKILQAFKTWDKDGNGFITKDELADVQLGGLNAGKRACLGWKSRKQMICFLWVSLSKMNLELEIQYWKNRKGSLRIILP